MLETLEGEPRVKEVAAMIGGRQYSETSLDNARELIQKAESWKQAQGKVI